MNIDIDYIELLGKVAPISETSISKQRLHQIGEELGKTQFRTYVDYHFGYNLDAPTALELQKTLDCSFEHALMRHKMSAEYLIKNQGKSCLTKYVKNGLGGYHICSPYFLTLIERPSIFRDLETGEDDLHVYLGLYFDDVNIIIIEHDKCSICGEFDFTKTNFTESRDFDIDNLLLTVLCTKRDCVNAKLDKLISEKQAEINEAQEQINSLKHKKRIL